MTHSIFGKEIFLETAFERRSQAMLRSALHKRSWHIIVADPGSGKTMGIRDVIRTTVSSAILAVTAPKNDETTETVGEQVQMRNSPKCTFFGMVSIDLKRFLDCGMRLVECPDCARTRTLSPRNGVLRFPTHSQAPYPDLTYRASMGQGKDGLGRGWRREQVRRIYTVAWSLFRERIFSHGTLASRRFSIVTSGCHVRCFITAHRHHHPPSPRRPGSRRADRSLHLVPGPCPGWEQLRVFPG
jgi:hypothetical protein